MEEWFEKEEKEIETVKCPVCEEEFRDLRGLTSHARNVHELSREDTYGLLENKNEDRILWKLIIGVGLVILSVFTAGNLGNR